MNRQPIVTRRVTTPFGSLYAHVTYDRTGPCAVEISTPGKHHDKAVHDAMVNLGEAITEILAGGAMPD